MARWSFYSDVSLIALPVPRLGLACDEGLHRVCGSQGWYGHSQGPFGSTRKTLRRSSEALLATQQPMQREWRN